MARDEESGSRRAAPQTDENGGGENFGSRRTGAQTNENNGGAPATTPASGRTGGQSSTSIYAQPGPSRTGDQTPTSTSSQPASGRDSGSFHLPSAHITRSSPRVRDEASLAPAAANSDKEYRELVETWFDDEAPRGADCPSGKIRNWNKLKHTMIVMKSDKSEDGKCKWSSRIDYRTKFGLDSQHPHIEIAQDNSGRTFLIHPHHLFPFLCDIEGDDQDATEEFAVLDLEIKKNELTPEKVLKDFSEALLMSGMDEEKGMAQKIVDFSTVASRRS